MWGDSDVVTNDSSYIQKKEAKSMARAKKYVIAVLLALTLGCFMAMSAFAISASSKVGSSTFFSKPDIGADSNHGYLFRSALNGSQVLNQYTSAGSTPAGTYLTSWHYTGDASQGWEKRISADGKFAVICANNEWVAININRDNYSRANVYTLLDNYYGDVAIIFGGSGSGRTMSVTARGSYPAASLRIGTTPTPVGDGYNTSKYCEWSTNAATVFFEDDWKSARSTRLTAR